MAEYGTGQRRIPPARLSEAEFREMEAILADRYSDANPGLTWDFFRRDRNNSSDSLDEVLGEIRDKKGIRDFEILAEDDESRIFVSGGDRGCWIEFEASDKALGDVLQKVRAIEGIFREHRRITTYFPNFPSAFRRPALEIGEPEFVIHLSRDEIIEGILTRWLATLLAAPISFVFGFLLGRVTS